MGVTHTQLGLFDEEREDVVPLAPVPIAPAPSFSEMLRPYQRQAVDAAFEALKTMRSALTVMATGTGKTTVFCEVARRWPGRVLVLAHRDELILQAADRLELALGRRPGIEKAEMYSSPNDRVVVGSIQTVHRDHRLKEMGDFDLVITDEGHHYTAETYRKPLEHWTRAKVLGYTATPDRADEQALGQIFEDVCYTLDTLAAIDGGWLVPVRAKRVRIEEIDLSTVGKVAGDLNIGALDEAMEKGVEGIVSETLRLEPNRQAICFFPGVLSAEHAARVFSRYKPNSAICISAQTDIDLRRRLTKDFVEGRYQYLCNCQVATEGFDAPGVSLIVQGRPTLSRSLYSQMAGRGLRPEDGLLNNLRESTDGHRKAAIASSEKPDCVLLDFVGNTDSHSLITPVDMLGGDYTPEEVQRAKKKEKKEPGDYDAKELLERSRQELAAYAARRRAAVRAKSWEVDPFKIIGARKESLSYIDSRFGFQPMTQAQYDGLVKIGFTPEELKDVGKHGANKLFAENGKRIEKGLASYKQIKAIRRWADCPDDITFYQAHKVIDYMYGAGTVDPIKLNRLIHGEE